MDVATAKAFFVAVHSTNRSFSNFKTMLEKLEHRSKQDSVISFLTDLNSLMPVDVLIPALAIIEKLPLTFQSMKKLCDIVDEIEFIQHKTTKADGSLFFVADTEDYTVIYDERRKGYKTLVIYPEIPGHTDFDSYEAAIAFIATRWHEL